VGVSKWLSKNPDRDTHKVFKSINDGLLGCIEMKEEFEVLIWIAVLILAGVLFFTVEEPLNLIAVGIILLIPVIFIFPLGEMSISIWGGIFSGLGSSIAFLFGIKEQTGKWSLGIASCIAVFIFMILWAILTEAFED